MALHEALIREEKDGSISFGDYTLEVKSKMSDFEHNGDLYKVKTYNEITKLEKNGLFIYESVPGTAVSHMNVSEKEVSFFVSGSEDAQITLELEAEKEYKILIDETNIGKMKTNLGGKLVLSVELTAEKEVQIQVIKC
ncbi:MAG: endosialidase [Clostridiales bacterium]|nr:endosialidase [Clostridiales bacterium]